MSENVKKGNVQIIIAIIAAALIIGLALIYSNSNPNTAPEPLGENGSSVNVDNVLPVGENDYLLGNRNAPITIVEYSDMECPFCKRFHMTMHQIIENNGDNVAWVYRHFPLQIHRKAFTEAHATECVGELAGNDTFWNYLDKIYEITPSSDGLDLDLLPQLAVEFGVNEDDFNACMDSQRHAEKINAQTENAMASGGSGTPFSVIIGPNGQKTPISGAQPREVVQQIIDSMLSR